MVSLLIKNGLVVTMDKDRRIIPEGSVVVEDGRILSVKRGSVAKSKSEEVIDARGKIVMPGLICSHTHLSRIFMRDIPLNMNSSTDFYQVLQQVRWPMEDALTKDDAYVSALFSCLEFIKAGVTMFADTFPGQNTLPGVLDKIASAVEESGIRGIISFEATERRTHAEGAKGTKENERFIRKLKKERMGRVHGMFSVYASFTVSDELFHYVRELASRYKVPVTIHVAEGLIDVYHSYERYGKRVIERLKDAGMLEPDVVLSHCVHVNDEELALIKKSGAKVAHNPMSNMLNGVGVAPVPKMISMGIPVGLGNDGYFFDEFENIRAAYLLHKLALHTSQAISPVEVLEMATIRGAELYGLQNELGSIEAGKLADIIILDPSEASTPIQPQSVIPYLVNGASRNNVETVIVGGNIIMRDRKVQSIKEEEVAKTAKKATEKLWEKLGFVRR